MSVFRITTLSLVFHLTAFCQLPTNPQDRCVWEDDKIVLIKEDMYAKNRIEVLGENDKIVRKIPAPPRNDAPYPGDLYFLDGRFFCTRGKNVQIESGRIRIDEILEFVDERWVQLAHYRHSHGLVRFLPIRNDLYIGATIHPHAIEVNGKSYPFGLFKTNAKSQLELTSVYDLGLEKPFFNAKNEISYPSMSMSVMTHQSALTGDQLVIASDYGHFWVFDLNKGTMVRSEKLFSSVTDKMLEKNALFPALLGFQPTRDGAILIASRCEDAVLYALNTHESPVGKTITQFKEWIGLTNSFNPTIRWSEFEPQTGKFRDVANPIGVPTQMKSTKGAFDFNWRFKTDGNLKFSKYSERYPEPSKEDLVRVDGES